MIRVRIAATGLLAIGSLALSAHEVRSTASRQPTGYHIRRRNHQPGTTTVPTTPTTGAPTATTAAPAPTTVAPATTAAPSATTRATTATTAAPATTVAPPTTAAPPTTKATTATTAPGSPGTAVRGGGMPLVSRGLPAFASSSGGGRDPSQANDAVNTSHWTSAVVPAWLAYDLSSVPAASRQQSLVAIYAERSNDYDNSILGVADWQQMPVDYTIETNAAPGGGQPPASGWSALVTVKNNALAAPHHLVQLNGANWVRVNVSRASSPTTVSLDVDVYSAPSGATDDWLFLGDSITSMTMQRLFEDPSVAQLVHNRDPSRWPGQIGGGIGGTNTNSAQDIIDARLANFPGRYVVLAYGTNDGSSSFHMEALVQKVIAAGKTPVVPHVPWSNTKAADLALMNTAIDGLYAKYPQILRGPDLWALTLNRTDYIPSGDVHPTEAGKSAFRAAYAAIM